MGDVKQFTVKRSSWLRGCEGRLLKKNGHKCCLGFLGQACGISNKVLLSHGSPLGLAYQHPETKNHWPEGLIDNEDELICINDAEDITDRQREKELKSEFKVIGINVKFID